MEKDSYWQGWRLQKMRKQVLQALSSYTGAGYEDMTNALSQDQVTDTELFSLWLGHPVYGFNFTEEIRQDHQQ